MKPGPKPKGEIRRTWSPNLAYAIGLITADGYLSKDGRHMSFTSKDKALVATFKKCLGLQTKLGQKFSGSGNLAYHTQFGDVLFYDFLREIGLLSAKSKTLGSLKIPRKYFRDFLRGYFDGDGSSYSYFDPVFPRSFRFYISFTSASPKFITWFREEMREVIGVKGFISKNKNNEYPQLKYAKTEAMIICKNMYANEDASRLKRKYRKILDAFRIIEKSRSGEIGRRAAFRAQ